MMSVLIIGSGNVGMHLYGTLLETKNIIVTQMSSRNISKVPNADVTIIAVSDNAIAEVSAKITNSFVVHTSGACAINELQNNSSKGVFYMLQTFTKDKKVAFSEVPFCLEAETTENYKLLKKLANSLGENIYPINSKQRKALHLAAVFVNNFTNHMYKIGNDICENNQIPFNILYPLIKETSEKITTLTPRKAQTGPAIRKDSNTIKEHLSLLNNKEQEIYKLLTKSIQNGN